MKQRPEIRTSLTRAAALALVLMGIPALAAANTKETERIDKTVPFAAGGTIHLKNFSGRVQITGENRSDVAIVAVRTAPRERLEHIKLAIEPSGSSLTIDANRKDAGWSEKNENVVETAFDIKVPASVDLDVDVFSSSVTVTGVTGHHHVHGFSSELHLDHSTGSVDAETFSGAIYLSPATWVKDQSLKAKTFSGDIEVRLPADAAGKVEFESFSGDINAEVPLMLESKTRRSLHARLKDGSGDGELSFKTFSGDVKLLK